LNNFYINGRINIANTSIQEVTREYLVPGKEYYVQCFERSHSPPNKPYKMIGRFERLEPSSGYIPFNWARFTHFRKVEDINNPKNCCYVLLNINWHFYEIARYKAQKDMETRAYNMVILQVVGDEYFKPPDFLK
jgi:hypothetical protein